ncbi:hypothetical protein D9M71_533390 [compost metagenome]
MKGKVVVASVLTAFLLMPCQAFAYLDPGTGSIIIQGIIGAIAASIVVIRAYWERLRKVLRIRSKKESTETSNKDPRK